MRVRFRGGVVAAARPSATSVVIDGDTIVWVGSDSDDPGAVDQVVELDGALMLPAFVDAHVHATSTGLLLTGIDLRHATSAGDLLQRVREHARTQPDGMLLGHGWDETTWTDPTLPTRSDLDDACGHRACYLSRIDVHSALVSTALVEAAHADRGADPRECAGYRDTSVSQEAHHAVREAALSRITPMQRRAAQQAFAHEARAHGIASVHEMAGPVISGEEDFREVLSLTDLHVVGYWGELARDGGVERARGLGATGAAGDLFVDGALGSRTACLSHAYADEPTNGASYLDLADATDHIVAATRAGLQAGFHVIGDAACSMVVRALHAAATSVGEEPLRAARHRLEHAEMLDDAAISTLARYQATASMQSVFDELWGGRTGMYAQRLGVERALTLNRLADLQSAGVPIALGSDTPVTPVGPWRAIRAAVHHRTPGQSLTVAQALAAHTVAGWRAAGIDHAGNIDVGQSAHLAVWSPTDIDIASWQSGIAVPAEGDPQAVATIVAGRVVHGALAGRRGQG